MFKLNLRNLLCYLCYRLIKKNYANKQNIAYKMEPQHFDSSYKKVIADILMKNKPLLTNSLGVQLLNEIQRINGGQMNEVFKIGQSLVIKIQRDINFLQHQFSVMNELYSREVKVPKIYYSGCINCSDSSNFEYNKNRDQPGSDRKDIKNFIIMEKIKGQTLSKMYYLSSQEQQKSIIYQVFIQLKKIHSLHSENYWIDGQTFKSMSEALQSVGMFSCIQNKKQQFGYIFGNKQNGNQLQQRVLKLKTYFHENKYILEDDMKPALIHNDLHFGNIMVDQNMKLTGIIDFDLFRKLNKSYELFRIFAFFLRPEYYVEQHLQQKWKGRCFKKQVKWMREIYPEMFSEKNLIRKIKIYFIEQMMNDLQNQCLDAFNDWFDNIFEGKWLEEMLS